MELIEYGGWSRCARLTSGNIEAVVTLEVGPRVIRLGFVGERNEFHENPREMGLTGGDEYHGFGGHRLWYAPEDRIETYQPENDAVEATEDNGWSIFTPKPNKYAIQKQIRIKPDGGRGFLLDHRITNVGPNAAFLAPWGITVMAPGGVCLVPQMEYSPIPAVLTPISSLALWGYTDITDPRLTLGRQLIKLRQDRSLGPTKIGAFVRQGYGAYLNGSNLFVKRFGADPEQSYPDRGCNFEAYTRQDVLEVESLAPMQTLVPGQYASHSESWRLYSGVTMPDEEGQAALEITEYANY